MDNEGPSHTDFTPEAWAKVLELHAERVAKQYGEYSFHHDLRFAADCIRDLQEQVEALRSGGGDLVRKIMASKESLTKRPS